MSSFESSLLWPPKGWPQFSQVDKAFGQAVAKSISSARIYGLQYKIETVPLVRDNARLLCHHVSIDGWEYSILNESSEYPVLSFTITDRFDETQPQECFLSDIRTYASSIPHTRRSANRALAAALFFIHQIDQGHVPDVNRVLRVYRLHPAQAFLYKKDKPLSLNLQKAFMDVREKSARTQER